MITCYELFLASGLAKIEEQAPPAKFEKIEEFYEHLEETLVKIDFLNETGQQDTAAFKVPYPPQWMQAIENALLKKKNGS